MVRLWSLVLLAAAVGSGTSPSDEAPLAWSPPVEGAVVRRFAPGVGPFEVAGHAGVDYGVPGGTPVRAAGDGVVAFTGQIAGAVFVVVAHGGGLRTTYGQLLDGRVRRLQAVHRGEVLGTSGGRGMHAHDPGVLHFGARVDGRPLDPLALFEQPDLTRAVRLVPADDAVLEVGSATAERRLAALWFSPPITRPPWLYGGGEGGGLRVGHALSRIGSGARWLAAGAGDFMGRALVVPAATVQGGIVLWAAGAGVRDWWTLRDGCSSAAPPPGGVGRAGRRLVVVAGVNSSTRPDGATNDLAADRLGYSDDEVTWFSYAPDGGLYAKADTHVGPEVAAERLAQQLRAVANAHPGHPIDLVGHSQGGVVVEAFLKEHYAGHPGDYPSIGRVITLAAPHRGVPLGALAVRLARVPGAASAAELLGDLPPPDSPSTRQLAQGSEYLNRLGAIPLPEGPTVTTIGAAGDVLVTADQTALGGATHVIVDPPGLADHGAILSDPGALDAMRLALAGLPPPCLTLPEAVRNRVEPSAIHAAERLLAS